MSSLRLADLVSESRRTSIPPELIAHVEELLSGLSRTQLVWVTVPESLADRRNLTLVVVAWDYPGMFATLCGLLSAGSFEIDRGSIITTEPIEGRRAIVDIFHGSLDPAADGETWLPEFRESLNKVVSLMEQAAQNPAAGGNNPFRQEARQLVIEAVSRSLSERKANSEGLLMPMDLVFEQIGESDGSGARIPKSTRLQVKSTDTPFFLYSVSVSLGLHSVSIENVEIRTDGNQVSDSFELTDENGKAILDNGKLNRIRLSVLLSKQFTHFLDRAPDPSRALERFDSLIQDIVTSPENDDIKTAIASPAFQRELALLLGTSDFIWEDFLRMQHENLRPLFAAVEEHKQLSLPDDGIETELRGFVNAATTHDERVSRLNEFKDRQSFLIDLDHILVKDLDFFFLSRRLTALADAVVRMAVELASEELLPLYGKPRTAAGVEAEWAGFGLGKLGGSALGYASDIELMFLFADNGNTDGGSSRENSSITNRDYFERLFKLACNVIQSRREGIFHVDLRLRPFGLDGPVAVKLESFAEYFGKGGQAHSAEKLALVRMRQIAGNTTLGTQVLAVRDRLIYETDNIDIPSLRDLRRRQLSAKGADEDPRGGRARVNAKFSPGALVDLEYNVQILQIIHGRMHPELRVPGIHEALRRLSELGTIEEDEAETMVAAYRFLRNLINGLRMLRGNAQDLFLPEPQDIEYQHLARRMAYLNTTELSAAEQLRIDFANHTALVRNFVEKHLGRDAIPTEASGSPADLVLSESVDEDMSTRILESAGFRNPQRAMVNLRVLAGESEQRRVFARLIVLAWDSIRSCPDSDMALNNWEGLVSRLNSPVQHYEQLLSQHKRMQFLIQLMSTSQFLADTLMQNPDFFNWISDPRVVAVARTQTQMESDLRLEALAAKDRTDWLNRLRRFRKREILRIGLRDIGLGRRMEEIMGEISFLARAVIEVGVEEAGKRVPQQLEGTGVPGKTGEAAGSRGAPGGAYSTDGAIPAVFQNFCILAFGKLGGWELNYSSDIDLLVVYRPRGESRTDAEERYYAALTKALVQDLTDFTSEGQAYRVDLRLRPYGNAGPLVNSVKQVADYYDKNAALWEHQALIKLKPVAGNLALGEELLALCKPLFIAKWDGAAVRNSIKSLRDMAVKQHTKNLGDRFEVKNGTGGIRDIEFLIQGMQMVYCAEHEEILTGNTLKAMSLLCRFGYLSATEEAELADDYKLLRRVEHYLQLYEDRQLHALPDDSDELRKLALSVGRGTNPESFFRNLTELRSRVRGRYEAFLKA